MTVHDVGPRRHTGREIEGVSHVETCRPETEDHQDPGPDHPITIERNAHRVVFIVAGRAVADTRAALTLREASYPPVHYIPRTDVDTALLERTDHATYCPYKGDCAYYSIPWGASVRSKPSGPVLLQTRISLRLLCQKKLLEKLLGKWRSK
jgi:uncharacterized protein (DUF427 family)